MTSRDRVLRALEFAGPDRAPRELWTLPWAGIHHPLELAAIQKEFPSDIANAPAEYAEPPFCLGDPYALGTFRDEWGCVFENVHEGAIGEVKKPLVKDWKRDIAKVHFPLEWLSFDSKKVEDFYAHTDLFVKAAACPRPFEQLQFLRGPENLLMDLADPCDVFLEFLDRMHQFYCRLLRRWAETPVDGLMFMDDWGSQHSMLISPRMWRNLFRPLYQDYVEIAHQHGKKAFMHTDGWVVEILPDLIEIGVDALNSQVFCMGVDRLAPFAGQICFWGEIDRQHLLVNGSPEEVRAAVEDFHSKLSFQGGVIAQCEFGLMARPENIREVFRTWDECSRR